ncbi:sensor histidine kinase [uncultured Jatrophihabitans sp.]|uniref:sensor histidine kinase n=1 Tax=uncultured Jatrophihabitans sp. TaxID=1610747 RepID=UPI0035CAD802
MEVQLRRRIALLRWSVEAVVVAAVSLTLFILITVGTALIVVSAGIPIVLGTVLLIRPLADLQRRRIPMIDGHGPIPSPYLHVAGAGWLGRLRLLVRDPARRRDVYWLLADGTLGLVLAVVGIVEAVLDLLLIWWAPPGLALRGRAVVGRALLSTSEKSRLALRVEQLTESRAETVDTSAAELRRIERDLHDGAQARMVSVGMTLALAEDQFADDPEAALALVAEARASSSAALTELRDLVRGIHPPVLADRGLVGAVHALALASPLPADVHADGVGRLPAPVESAAYFAVAEALANVIKHSGARHAVIALEHAGDTLRVAVRDDGRGGADPACGTGLRGIERRLSAFDGSLAVSSPPGGPTVVAMVLPCASSSPKTLPSSATG